MTAIEVVGGVNGFLRGRNEKITDTTDPISEVRRLIESILCFKGKEKLMV